MDKIDAFLRCILLHQHQTEGKKDALLQLLFLVSVGSSTFNQRYRSFSLLSRRYMQQ